MSPPKLLDQVREAARLRHLSLRTEQAYVGWIRRFVLFHGKRHPREMGAKEIRGFLSDLAVHRRVSASTQNQAFEGPDSGSGVGAFARSTLTRASAYRR